MADPGFHVVGRGPRRGRGVPRRYVLKILYVETKESGPSRGACAGPLDPPMVLSKQYTIRKYLIIKHGE